MLIVITSVSRLRKQNIAYLNWRHVFRMASEVTPSSTSMYSLNTRQKGVGSFGVHHPILHIWKLRKMALVVHFNECGEKKVLDFLWGQSSLAKRRSYWGSWGSWSACKTAVHGRFKDDTFTTLGSQSTCRATCWKKHNEQGAFGSPSFVSLQSGSGYLKRAQAAKVLWQ